MQPAVIEQLERLPRLATGKPDRRRLPAVERGKRRGKEEYLAPQLLLHQQLVQIWTELLEARPIGIRDNFFDLGGHSLLAAQLVGRIERVYGKRLALSTLFAKPTIEQLAVALQESGKEREKKAGILPLQAGGSRRPFFFLHGDWTGGAFYCFALARASGAEQPFYVLEPYAFSDRDGAPTLEAIASAHIEAMRGVQARGPYRLGGFCNGGLLAYEMARQLERDGEQVEFLGLINPSEPIQTARCGRHSSGCIKSYGRGAGGRQTCTCGPGTRSGTFTGACGREEAGWRTSGSCWRSSRGWQRCSRRGRHCTKTMWGSSIGRRRAIGQGSSAARSPFTGRGRDGDRPVVAAGYQVQGGGAQRGARCGRGAHVQRHRSHPGDCRDPERMPEQSGAGSPPPRAGSRKPAAQSCMSAQRLRDEL